MPHCRVWIGLKIFTFRATFQFAFSPAPIVSFSLPSNKSAVFFFSRRVKRPSFQKFCTSSTRTHHECHWAPLHRTSLAMASPSICVWYYVPRKALSKYRRQCLSVNSFLNHQCCETCCLLISVCTCKTERERERERERETERERERERERETERERQTDRQTVWKKCLSPSPLATRSKCSRTCRFTRKMTSNYNNPCMHLFLNRATFFTTMLFSVHFPLDLLSSVFIISARRAPRSGLSSCWAILKYYQSINQSKRLFLTEER